MTRGYPLFIGNVMGNPMPICAARCILIKALGKRAAAAIIAIQARRAF